MQQRSQGILEMKISKLGNVIANARIMDDSNIDASKAFIFSNEYLEWATEWKYNILIVENEADPSEKDFSEFQ